jgi:hypothetical protein
VEDRLSGLKDKIDIKGKKNRIIPRQKNKRAMKKIYKNSATPPKKNKSVNEH